MNERIHLRNFRAFFEPQPISISRINVLVGENSSGKSAFLAGYRVAADVDNGVYQFNFNEPPFELGSYDQIAHFRGGRGGRRRFFEVGVERPTAQFTDLQALSGTKLGEYIRKTATFRAGLFEPYVDSLEYRCGNISITIENYNDIENSYFIFRTLNASVRMRLSEIMPRFFSAKELSVLGVSIVFRFISDSHFAKETLGKLFDGQQSSRMANILKEFCTILVYYESQQYPRPIAFAPVRMKPSRTYNPLSETKDPEGGHIPMTLARISSSSPQEWNKIRRSLEQFAKSAGLFQHIKIRRFGQKGADPFQVQIQVMGQPANMIDVGYGVSQILPFIVELLRCEHGQTFLLQQPEVHLHPRAQAELASFVASIAIQKDLYLLIETHSDYFIDRMRYETRNKKSEVNPKDVNILFFEKGTHNGRVHNLALDEEGNIVNPPTSYREFFLEETNKILGI